MQAARKVLRLLRPLALVPAPASAPAPAPLHARVANLLRAGPATPSPPPNPVSASSVVRSLQLRPPVPLRPHAPSSASAPRVLPSAGLADPAAAPFLHRRAGLSELTTRLRLGTSHSTAWRAYYTGAAAGPPHLCRVGPASSPPPPNPMCSIYAAPSSSTRPLTLHLRQFSSSSPTSDESDSKSRLHKTDEDAGSEMLQDYMKRHGALVTVPDKATDDYHILTANSDQPYMLHEDIKIPFRSLLVKLDEVHLEKKCYSSPITKENIIVTPSGEVKLVEDQKVDLTEEGLHKNFADASSCMSSLLIEQYGEEVMGKLPKGLGHLLDSMADPNCTNKTYLLANHSELLPVSVRAIAIIKMYLLLREQMPKVDAATAALAQSILSEAAQPYSDPTNHWVDIVKNNNMLKHWYNFRGGKLYTPSAESLMDLHRHVTHHPFEHESQSPTGVVTFESVQNLLLHSLPLFIPKCQFALWRHGLLKPLKLHLLFPSSPEPYGR